MKTHIQTRIRSIGELCEFQSGKGFGPRDWKESGLPIIRIQNLNGSKDYNYFSGTPEASWTVEPGDLLFAWAGVKGVSFGPTIWHGPRGVLNQHIYRIRPKGNINKEWLYYALLEVTSEIESKAHGFKTNLVHVRKADISDAKVSVPDLKEQARLVDILSQWDIAINKATNLVSKKEKAKNAYSTLIFTGKRFSNLEWLRADQIFRPVSERGRDDLEVLSATQDKGVIPRRMLDKQILMESFNPKTYKVVRPGDFVISLRSFEGGFELSNHEGIISPAYTVLRPQKFATPQYFRHYLKSFEFIQRLSVAVIGIRDGKQISFSDLSSVKLPVPSETEQQQYANLLNLLDKEIELLRLQLAQFRLQRQGLMRKLFSYQSHMSATEVLSM